MKTSKVLMLIGITVLVAPQIAMAGVGFHQLDDDFFVVSHENKGFRSRTTAIRVVHEKAASLCVAAGYTHLKIVGQESQTLRFFSNPNASIRVRFFFEKGEERIDCRRNASEKYIGQAAVKLMKKGYQRPARPD